MILPKHLSKNLARTCSLPIPPGPNLIRLKLMNRKSKTGMKMDNDKAPADSKNYTSDPMPGMHAMTTQTSAHLLDKLQKLKDTPSTNDVTPMDCDTEDIKKQTRASNTKAIPASTSVKINQTPTPEAKRSRNGATPPPAKTAQAAVSPQSVHYAESVMEMEDVRMESISEEVEGLDRNDGKEVPYPKSDLQQHAPQDDREQLTHKNPQAQEDLAESDNTQKDDNNQGEKKEPKETNQEEALSDVEVTPVQEVDPKEWRKIHDEWLHAAMRVAMGNTTITGIPDIENVERMERKPFMTNLRLQPSCPFCRQYDLRLAMTGGDDQITLIHQALVKWYQKV